MVSQTPKFTKTLQENEYGIAFYGASNNFVYHNYFINNSRQVSNFYGTETNSWDNGSEGNYWSDYNGTDTNEDGIGDIPYVIDENNQDNYPLMSPDSANPSLSYKLVVDSVPSGVTFTADDTSCTAPWSETYNENTTVSLTMPESYSYEGKNYTWSRWSDGNTNRTRTITVNKNIALTAMFTPEDTSPVISVLSPENRTYFVKDVPLEYTVNRFFYWTTYSLDGQLYTDTKNTTLSGLADGTHQLTVYANYTDSNMGETATVWFTVDTTPPNITDVIQTPVDSKETPDDRVRVNATVTDTVSGVERVSLNYTDGNGTWIIAEMTNLEGDIWNGTIPAFPHGTNVTYIIIAEDKAGNTVTTEQLYGHPNEYKVLPEFPLWIILPLFLVATASTLVARKRLSIPAFTKIYNNLHKLLS